MRIYEKRTMQPYCIYLYREEAVRLIDPDDWFIIGTIREKLDVMINGDASSQSGSEESADRS